MRTENENYYIDKEELNRLINEYYDTNEFSRELADVLLLMCKKILSGSNFSGYSPLWKEEMLSDGYYKVTQTVLAKRVDTANNAFAYLTRCAWQGFVERIKSEKQRYADYEEYREGIRAEAQNKIQNRKTGSAEVPDTENDEIQSWGGESYD